ncbi:MAG: T9SS type A sorting domain-containing protein [Bacteroidota bacterium]
MKRLLLFTASILLSASMSWAQLIITGVVDGPLTGGTPKAIELFALSDIPDLGIYGLGAANNGGGTDGIEFSLPHTSMAAGSFFYVTSDIDQFTGFFGFPANVDGGSSALINGDDAIELFRYSTVVDVFGDINVDGSGQAWEYLDGWAYRAGGTGPDGSTFVPANFSYSGPNALDGETSNATAATPFPLGSYSTIVVDGTLDPQYGAALCVQNNTTGFGDNNNPAIDIANGSELDAAYAVVDGGMLYLFLSGNLETNFNKLEIFIDAQPGGQNRLLGTNPDVDFNGLNRMGDDGNNNGLVFDNDFFANYYFTASGGNSPYELYANTAPTDGSGGMGTFLGGGLGNVQSLVNGGTIAIDNSNVMGVSDMMLGNPAAVNTGIEWSIPLSEIGNPMGLIRITAFVNGGGHDFLSNQVLCGIGNGQANLGEPRNVDFSNIGGDQYFSLCAGIDGGSVLTEDGLGTVYTCPGDGLPDWIRADSSTSSTVNYSYVVTDANATILTVLTGDSINLDGAGIGECWIWGLAYTGNLTAMIGDNAAQVALSDSCFDLSDNFIRVVRDTAGGGMVMTEAGQDTAFVCIGSSQQSAVIAFDSTGNSNANYTYVVTDANAVILGLSDDGLVDFSQAPPGECWVWGLSYTGMLTAQVGDDASQVALSDECFDLSSNFVVVFREAISAGEILTAAGQDTVYYCLDGSGGGTGMFRVDSLNVLGGENFNYVITDNQGIILALPGGDMIDVSGAGIGECWVWGLNYTGNVLAQPGDNAATTQLTDGCYDLSDNYVVAFRDSINGGEITTEMNMDTVYYCPFNPGGDDDGIFVMDSSNTAGPKFSYVVTDNNAVILGVPGSDSVDVSGAGVGECWVWGLSYTGNIVAQVGDTASMVDLTDGCYDLSDNFVVIFRDSLSGGEVLTADGLDTARVCVSDGDPDILDFQSVGGATGGSFTYVVTDTATKILGLPPSNMVDFSNAGGGECWVWGLSFTGDVLVGLGDTAATAALSSACYALSANYVVVYRDTAGGACSVGLEDELGFRDIAVYPNPVQDQLYFSFRSTLLNAQTSELTLYSLTGQSVRTAEYPTLPIGENRFQLSVAGLSSGLYMLAFRNGERRITRQIVIE